MQGRSKVGSRSGQGCWARSGQSPGENQGWGKVGAGKVGAGKVGAGKVDTRPEQSRSKQDWTKKPQGQAKTMGKAAGRGKVRAEL